MKRPNRAGVGEDGKVVLGRAMIVSSINGATEESLTAVVKVYRLLMKADGMKEITNINGVVIPITKSDAMIIVVIVTVTDMLVMDTIMDIIVMKIDILAGKTANKQRIRRKIGIEIEVGIGNVIIMTIAECKCG